MNIYRTPDERFANLVDYPFEPHYLDIPAETGGTGKNSEESLRIHYVDEGPHDANPVLLLHGEPSWSYLYRHMIPPLAAAGHRTLAPDLVGFGRSDKPSELNDYSYQRHVAWMKEWLLALDLWQINLFCQDWGSLIGLRLVAEMPDRFARVIVGNGGLPTGDQPMSEAFSAWQKFSQEVPVLKIGDLIQGGCASTLSAETIAAYDAPFPDESFKAGARIFPALVPTTPDDPAAEANRAAWQMLMSWQKPFLTTFSDGDPITRGGDRLLQKLIPGTKGQPHVTIKDAGHFLQEDKGPELAQVIINFIAGS